MRLAALTFLGLTALLLAFHEPPTTVAEPCMPIEDCEPCTSERCAFLANDECERFTGHAQALTYCHRVTEDDAPRTCDPYCGGTP